MNVFSKISNHPFFNKGLVFFDQAMVSGSSFILGILLVRWIGIDAYGIFALLWMCVLFALGINQAFVTKPLLSIAPKMEAKDKEAYFRALHTIQIVVSVLFLILGIAIYFLSNLFFEENISTLIPITSGIICCQLLHDYYRKIAFVKEKLFHAIVLDGILYLGQLVGVIVIIFMEKIGLVEALSCVLVANILSVIVGGLSIGIEISNTNFLKKIFLRHFHFSKWLLSTSILQWLSGNYFIIVGASILGTTAVGAIRMVQNIMGLFHVLFLAMENVVPIEAAQRYHLDGESTLIKYLTQLTWKLGIGFLIALGMLSFFSPQILKFLYGAEAVQHSYLVIAYSCLYLFVFIGYPLRFFMRTIEITHPIFIAYVLSSIFSLFSAKILLNTYGMNGLIFGLFATQIIALITYLVFVNRRSVHRRSVHRLSKVDTIQNQQNTNAKEKHETKKKRF